MNEFGSNKCIIKLVDSIFREYYQANKFYAPILCFIMNFHYVFDQTMCTLILFASKSYICEFVFESAIWTGISTSCEISNIKWSAKFSSDSSIKDYEHEISILISYSRWVNECIISSLLAAANQFLEIECINELCTACIS